MKTIYWHRPKRRPGVSKVPYTNKQEPALRRAVKRYAAVRGVSLNQVYDTALLNLDNELRRLYREEKELDSNGKANGTMAHQTVGKEERL